MKNLSYYSRGFFLLNKNIDLFIFGLIINIPTIFSIRLSPIILFPLSFISIIYNYFLILILLNSRYEKVNLTYDEIFKTFIDLFKKLVFWISLTYVLALILIISTGFIDKLLLGQNTSKEFLKTVYTNEIMAVFLIECLLFLLLGFLPIYLGFKNNSFLESIKNSIKLACNNLSFTYLALPLLLLSFGLSYFFSVMKLNTFMLGIDSILDSYFKAIILSSFLMYFKDLNKSESSMKTEEEKKESN